LIAKALYDQTKEVILVICYTNHALDQFLEDILDMGIPADAMVRLGAKSTPRTEGLNLSKQSSNFRRTGASWDIINKLKDDAEAYKNDLTRIISAYRNLSIGKTEILDCLEFSDEESGFCHALSTPVQQDGMIRVGRKGKAIGPHYLLDRWVSGQDAGIFKGTISEEHVRIWEMDVPSRKACMARWTLELLKENVDGVYDHVRKFNLCQERLSQLFNEKSADTIKKKRVIGCTTTAAAKYTHELQNAAPGVILVEEAGEILESHILTAMTPDTKQLVLIGDHKQLRPKVNNYALTLEKGNGYNLNVSLFERLVLAGFPHTTLTKQHRMCPEISSLVRDLTYPELLDAPKTLNRPKLRGFQDKVVFFQHEHPEVETAEIADRRDEGSKSSKKNLFEVEMVLKCVRYLGQQGYGTDKLVVLTPYLGQLRLLRDKLSEENDPVLNDLDSYDLVQAGLLPAASANLQKRPIKISTIGQSTFTAPMITHPQSPSTSSFSRQLQICCDFSAFQK
jgi:AAA domain